MLTRRRWLATSVRGITGIIVWRCAGGRRARGGGRQVRSPKTVSIVEFSQTGDRGEVTKVPMLVKSEQEWRDQLSPLAFEVTRRAATERPFTGVYWNFRDKGLYRCICCDTAVFGSDKKFHSDTGWPSFWAPLAEAEHERARRLPVRNVPRCGFVPAVRWPSRARLRRRTGPHGSALLHQLRLPAIRAGVSPSPR